ncbi:unnamed protein product [Toxocara canis]|uniref:SprT-like domain-containing protein n=1 Tax=Toxocara canis TaxID=6265 RepID=A0A183UHU4_TOXCA|nr:unnamed protein product [Toxocara canis]
MPLYLRRVVLDDSSDVSMGGSVQSDVDCSSKLRTKPSDSVEGASNPEYSMEQSIRFLYISNSHIFVLIYILGLVVFKEAPKNARQMNPVSDVSQVLQHMSLVEGVDSEAMKSECGESEHEVESAKWNSDVENSYLEDSFLVKDSDSEEGDISSGFDCDQLSAVGELFNPSSSRYTRPAKYAESTPLRAKLPLSTTHHSDKAQRSVLDSVDNDESRRLLVELYPELMNNDSTRVLRWSIGMSKEESEKKSERDGEENEESYEKCTCVYLKQLKGDKLAKEASNRYDDDLDNFIVGDDESLLDDNEEKSSEGEDGKSRDDEVSSKYAFPCEESETKRGPYEIIPPSEKARSRGAIVKIFAEGACFKDAERQPTVNRKRVKDDELFLMALSPNGPEHPEAEKFTRSKFAQIRKDLTAKLFDIYRRRCFEEKLDEGMKVEWNARLLKTAGRCRCMRDGTASIELSIKVCNSAGKCL